MHITHFTNVTFNTSDLSGQGNETVEHLTSPAMPSTDHGVCHLLKESGLLPWENPLNPVGTDIEQLVDRIKAVLVVPVVCVTGCPASCVNMAVFYKLGLKERINTCLFILSVLNLVHLIFGLGVNGERAFALSAPRYGPTYRFIVENHILGFHGTSWAANFVSVIISSERCFCIYHPLRSQSLLTTRTMAIFLTLSCLVITSGFFVISEKYNMICIYDSEHNSTFLQMSKSTSYYARYQNIIDIFDGTVYGFLLPVVSVVVDLGCSVAMVVKLRKTLSWRINTSSAVPHKEILLTKMLVCLSIQHGVFLSPNLCFRTAAMFSPDLKSAGKHFNTVSLMISISEMFTFVNSCSPFFVYYFVGSKYRHTLHKMLKITKDTSSRSTFRKSKS